jgi:hypothetical protein
LKRKRQKNNQQPSKQQKQRTSSASSVSTSPTVCSSDDESRGIQFDATLDMQSDLSGEEDNEPMITTIFKRTEPKEWKEIGSPSDGRHIDPLPFTGESKLFTP